MSTFRIPFLSTFRVPLTRRSSADQRQPPNAQRRPEITPGYDPRREGWDSPERSLNEGRRLPPATTRRRRHRRRFRPRSTKAGDYPRLRPLSAPVSSFPARTAQRRPEITPGYDSALPYQEDILDRPFRSTKAGDYPRLRPTSARHRTQCRLRRSTKAGDYPRLRLRSRVSARQPGRRSTKAGDYPRLRPAGCCPGSARKWCAQRRPEITPGYDTLAGRVGRPQGSRSTKAGDYPRLRRAAAPTPRSGSPGTLNEGRRLPPATTGPLLEPLLAAILRSTKAGDYPRLRHRRSGRSAPVGYRAQRRPEITPGYDQGSGGAPGRAGFALNEGRRLPPATTRVPGAPRDGQGSRSTKAGDYPRLRPAKPEPPPVVLPRALNEGRRLPPATTNGKSTLSAALACCAQRRPEITPGYDDYATWDDADVLDLAQRRPEITPGYDARCLEPRAGRGRRSTKAGDYPRLRRRAGGTAAPGNPRSTKAGDYPRLRPRQPWQGIRERSQRSTKAGDYPRLRPAERRHARRPPLGAQRRPEITPGYDVRASTVEAQDAAALNEGRRLPPATTIRAAAAAAGLKGDAQRRPEITPGYDTKVGVWPMTRLLPAQRRPEITPGYDDATRRDCRPYPSLNEGRRLPPATTSVLLSVAADRADAQRRPEITPGYDSKTGPPGGRGRSRSTKAGDYPRLRPPAPAPA